MDTTERSEKKHGTTICGALRHPLRVRILEVLNEGPLSPSEFVESGLVPDEYFESYQRALSLSAYHFRALAKEGCVRVVETIPRRGALERVYEGTARVYFTDAEFDSLTHAQRREFSRIAAQGLIARTDMAMRADTFDARSDRHLTWMPMQLDERGWAELMTAMTGCFGEVEQIRHEAAARLRESDEDAIPVTYGMLGFESPAPAERPGEAQGQASVGR